MHPDLAYDNTSLIKPPGHWPVEADILSEPSSDTLDKTTDNKNKNKDDYPDTAHQTTHNASPPAPRPVNPVTAEEWLSPGFQPVHMRQIIQESVLVAAGAAAILLQVASPGIAAGVGEHSNFTARVPDRLRATMTYLYCIAFGTPAEKRAVADAVTRVHGRVRGTIDTISPCGIDNDNREDNGGVKKRQTSYSALDPDLQLWVAATLYHTGLDIYQQVFGPIITDEILQDEIYREYAIIAIALQVPADMWPPSRAAFRHYWDTRIASAQQNITRRARDVARDLLYLPKSPWYLRIFTPSLRCITAGLLPEALCAEFGLRGGGGFWYRAHIFALKVLYRPLPLCVRSAPVRFYLANMRKRLREKSGSVP